MSSHAVMLLAALYLGAAPAPLPEPDRDLKKMQGVWLLASYGSETGILLRDTGVRVTVTGNRVTYTQGTARRVSLLTLDLDATKTPRAVKMRVVEGVGEGNVYLGAYRLEAETLTIHYDDPAGLVEVWKRVKK